MQTLPTTSGSAWTFGGNLLCLGSSDPYNPLGLPPYTMRFSFSDLTYDPVEASSGWPQGSTWTKVSQGAGENIWDFTYASTRWFRPFDPFWHLVLDRDTHECSCYTTVLGANLTGVTDMQWMLGYQTIVSVPLFDTRAVTNASSMLNSTSITSCPQYPLGLCETTEYMFQDAIFLEHVPTMELPSCTLLTQMFYGCSSLREAPMLSGVRSLSWLYTFKGATSLEHVPAYDFSYAEVLYGCFEGCSNLLEIPDFTFGQSLYNVNRMFSVTYKVGSGITRCYDKLSAIAATSTAPYFDHQFTFHDCGRDSPTGSQELALIPRDWKESW